MFNNVIIASKQKDTYMFTYQIDRIITVLFALITKYPNSDNIFDETLKTLNIYMGIISPDTFSLIDLISQIS